MKEQYFITIDAGTGAGRVIIFDINGKRVSDAYEEWEYVHCVEKSQGAYEFDANVFLERIVGILAEALRNSSINVNQVAAITCTSQRQGMVFIDKTGREIYAGPNRDVRAEEVLNEFDGIDDAITKITGLKPHPMYGLGRIKWFAKFDPQIYENINCVLMIADWIAYRLTGLCRSEASLASSSRMFDIEKRNYSNHIMELANLKTDIFCKPILATEQVGGLSKHIAGRTGIPSGTPVFIGGGDTQSGAIGMGVVGNGQIGVIAGTTSPIYAVTDSISERIKTSGMYVSCHAVDGLWGIEANGGNTGLSLRWARDLFLGNTDIIDKYKFMSNEAVKFSPGSGGVTAYLGTEITGKSFSSNYGGFIFPVSWNISEIKLGQLFRSVFEANIYSVCSNISGIEAVADAKYDILCICGGQTKNPFFVEGIANVSGKSVCCFEEPESTSLGSAITAAVGVGIYGDIDSAVRGMVRIREIHEPNESFAQEYINGYQKWCNLYQKINN